MSVAHLSPRCGSWRRSSRSGSSAVPSGPRWCCTSTGAPAARPTSPSSPKRPTRIPQLVPEARAAGGIRARGSCSRLDEGRRRSRRRWVASIAAAAAAAAIFSITIVRVVEADDTSNVASARPRPASAASREAGRRGDGGRGARDRRRAGPTSPTVTASRSSVNYGVRVGQLPHPGHAAAGRRDDDRHHDDRGHPRLVDRSEPRAAGRGLAHRAGRRRRARGVSRDGPHG